MTWEQILAVVATSSIALNGWFLREAWSEIKALRKDVIELTANHERHAGELEHLGLSHQDLSKAVGAVEVSLSDVGRTVSHIQGRLSGQRGVS